MGMKAKKSKKAEILATGETRAAMWKRLKFVFDEAVKDMKEMPLRRLDQLLAQSATMYFNHESRCFERNRMTAKFEILKEILTRVIRDESVSTHVKKGITAALNFEVGVIRHDKEHEEVMKAFHKKIGRWLL